MIKDVKVDREEFTNVVRKLLATPPLPQAAIPRKRSVKTVRPKTLAQKRDRSNELLVGQRYAENQRRNGQPEHFLIVLIVESVRKFLDVTIQVLYRDPVKRSDHTTFEQCPK
jgi:uncharacterized protein YdiU (UPF0061 family)